MTVAAAQKNYLRTRIKHQRNTLTTPFMERSALAVLGHVSSMKLIEDSQTIAFYLPLGGEISCMPLIQYALSLKKQCFVPKVFPSNKRGMWFLPYSGKDSASKGSFGIYEPTAPTSQAIRPSKIDVIFMPLIAFDNLGNRIGMGGGYYDSVLQNLNKNHVCPKLVGLAYNFQEVKEVTAQDWDIKLDAIATPSYYRKF